MTQQQAVTQFEALAAQQHFVVLTPDGIKSQWNTINVTPNADVTFLMSMLDQVESGVCVDTARVYSTGYSDGGLCRRCWPARRATGSPRSAWSRASRTGRRCKPGRPVPIIVFWGKQDLVLPFYGGLGEALRDLLDAASRCPPNLTAPTAPVAHQDGFPPVEQVVASWADDQRLPVRAGRAPGRVRRRAAHLRAVLGRHRRSASTWWPTAATPGRAASVECGGGPRWPGRRSSASPPCRSTPPS